MFNFRSFFVHREFLFLIKKKLMKRVSEDDEFQDNLKKLNTTVSQNWSFRDVLEYVYTRVCSNDTEQEVTHYAQQLREVWSKVKVAVEPDQRLEDCEYIQKKMSQLPTDLEFLKQFKEWKGRPIGDVLKQLHSMCETGLKECGVHELLKVLFQSAMLGVFHDVGLQYKLKEFMSVEDVIALLQSRTTFKGVIDIPNHFNNMKMVIRPGAHEYSKFFGLDPKKTVLEIAQHFLKDRKIFPDTLIKVAGEYELKGEVYWASVYYLPKTDVQTRGSTPEEDFNLFMPLDFVRDQFQVNRADIQVITYGAIDVSDLKRAGTVVITLE